MYKNSIVYTIQSMYVVLLHMHKWREQWKYLACRSSTLVSKPKLSDDCQCCCRLNVVIEAKKGGFWQGKEKAMAPTKKHTIEYFSGDVLLVMSSI